MKYLILLLSLFSFSVIAQSSMRRCSLLPITDSVGGAIGFKVFEEVEKDLKKSNWCTYISNSEMINVFSRYRENLPQYLKTKEVLGTVSERLKVGSIVLVSLKNELAGTEVEMTVYGENGEDIYFSEKTLLGDNEIDSITQAVKNWLDLYAKVIPYDAKINGILGEQITLDVGKGYPIQIGQDFVVRRPISKKQHPLLKKIVDWETEVLAQGKVFNISDNQALGMVKVYKTDKKLKAGDWVRLETMRQDVYEDANLDAKKEEETPGTLGILSVALFGSSSSVDTNTPTGNKRMGGNLFGIDFRAEGWITRQYFAALEIIRSLGTLKDESGNPAKSSVTANNNTYKITGGYKYLPIGFFYGPQIDIYGGYANHGFDLDLSEADGFGQNSISGLVFGTAANIPINRAYRFFAQAEFIPFPKFTDEDDIYGSAKSASAMELEIGVKYQYTPRMTVDGSLETLSRKAKFAGEFKEISYKDNRLKVGVSFNF
jgi:opacity protein-like surface antigen